MRRGIHRERPGADAIAACAGQPAIPLGEDIWMSPGLSNSYLLRGDAEVGIVNTGMGFEGPLHHRAYAGLIDGAGCPDTIVLTQGHFDHVGGVDVLRGEGTAIVAQANFERWRADNERLERFRARNAAFAWIDAIVEANRYAASLGLGAAAQARPEPTEIVHDEATLDLGGRTVVALSVPGGETTDALILWLPESRTLLSGNLTGPLFGHVPNLVTIRGDRYRDPLEYMSSLARARALRPARLLTGHFDPIEGEDRIEDEFTAMIDAMEWLHDRTIDGMNSGADVHTLMRDLVLPDRFDLGEGYGTTAWNVRAIWENYAGWFHHRSTTELYAVPRSAVSADVVEVAGIDALLTAARSRLEADEPVEALHLTDLILEAAPSHAPTRAVAAAASQRLLDRSTNFWEAAWLRRSIVRLAAPLDPAAAVQRQPGPQPDPKAATQAQTHPGTAEPSTRGSEPGTGGQ